MKFQLAINLERLDDRLDMRDVARQRRNRARARRKARLRQGKGPRAHADIRWQSKVMFSIADGAPRTKQASRGWAVRGFPGLVGCADWDGAGSKRRAA